jgi:sugar O-acyltransferase (sialic acid O-acetyltransferase NeuD family)
MDQTRIELIILGAGGHAKVVCDAAAAAGFRVSGFTDTDPAKQGRTVLDHPVLGPDEVVRQRQIEEVRLSAGMGNINARTAVFSEFSGAGYVFAVVVHPEAVVSASANLGEGTQILARAVVQPQADIGRNCVVNTGAIVEHDCRIGDHSFIAPGAILLGGVVVGDGALIGAGAVVLPGTNIGSDSIAAAGAVVTEDVPDGAKVFGIPARR